jgi:eukaryotic-like serine/threonine-protein kinase
MSDEKDKNPPAPGEGGGEAEEERTVFMPGGFGGTAMPADPTPEPPRARPEPPTTTPESPQTAPETPTTPAETPAAPVQTAPPVAFEPRADAAQIKVGDVLNHIFEVKRFLARGGMGEVFEGCNVNTDEKVAIKVMLPALASDEKVIAMFRKEARTLTKLHHQALVQYRVLAQEPQLHVLYIVTDYIEGTNLRDALGTLKLSAEELGGLLRRLASGLAEAHELGAVHRDISPDNIILEDDDIHEAKIIDFGIAKDLDASAATIVGDGFAGKLNYVAPEQLGDFGREVGPWSDVYSLALVMLAVAQGKNVDMSGSLVDAIDKRRRGPDLSAVPDSLKPLIEAMLRPNPQERLRSMADVLAMLDGTRIAAPAVTRASPPADPVVNSVPDESGSGGGGGKLGIVLLVVALLVALIGGAWYLTGGTFGFLGHPAADLNLSGTNTGSDGPPAADGRPPEQIARAAVDSILPSVPCTWLDIGGIEAAESGLTVAMRGVAGNGPAAQAEIGEALSRAGLANAHVTFGDVASINQAGCSALDTYRQVRAVDGSHISVTAPRYEMVTQADGPYRGAAAANALVDLNPGGATDFALLGIEPSGEITLLLDSRAAFEEQLRQSQNGRPISDEGDGRYRIHVDLNHRGWSGLLLITGSGPFDAAVVRPLVGHRGPDWQQQFLAAASGSNWRSEMIWFESVNRDPDAIEAGSDDDGSSETEGSDEGK